MDFALALTVAVDDSFWVSFVMDESARSLEGEAGTWLLVPGTDDVESWFERGCLGGLRESDELGGMLGGTSFEDDATTEDEVEDDDDGAGRLKGFGRFAGCDGRLGSLEGEVKFEMMDDLRSEAGL